MAAKDAYKEAMERVEGRLGTVYYPSLDYKEFLGRTNEVATKDAIRHFCNGIGDPNPLWRNPSYAENTKFGQIIAPPFFLNAIYPSQGQYEAPMRGPGEPTLSFFGPVTGHSWEWFQPIRVNDLITVSLISPLKFNDITKDEKHRYFQQLDRITYMNERGVVAICDVEAIYTEFLGDAKNQKADYIYSDEELAAIAEAYKNEEIRGGNPRYWEDVKEGDTLSPMVKGPLTHTDMLAFMVGIGWMDQAFGLKDEMVLNNPGGGFFDDNGACERICQIHVDNEIAKKDLGFQKAFDFGLQRCCWSGHQLTNWMGDDGFLKKLKIKWTKFNFIGDTTWCHARVIKKYEENGEKLVDLEIRQQNQRGIVTTDGGKATIALPSYPK